MDKTTRAAFDSVSREAKGLRRIAVQPAPKRLDSTNCVFLELYLGNGVAELFAVPTSLEFVRDYVSKNIPLVIRNATLDWPAVSKWNSKYFR